MLKAPDPRGRPRWPLAVVIGAAGVLLVAAGVWAGLLVADEDEPAPPPAPTTSAQEEPLLGVFRGTSRDAVEEYADWLGRPVDVVVDYGARDTWQDIARPDYLLEAWRGYDATLVLAVPMLPREGESTIEAGADGAYDEHFTTLAERLVATDHADAILRVGWEFNLEGSRWGTPDEEAFVTYWRRIVETMRGVEGAQFRFDWNPNNGDGNAYDAVEYYPGDDVVDFIGVDAYDQSGRSGTYPYPEDCDDRCRGERQRAAWDRQIYGGDRGLRFWAEFAREHGKPLSLPEWGLWDREDGTGGGENPFYIERMYDFISDPVNNVGYHAYFEWDREGAVHGLMTRFEAAGDLYRWLWSEEQ